VRDGMKSLCEVGLDVLTRLCCPISKVNATLKHTSLFLQKSLPLTQQDSWIRVEDLPMLPARPSKPQLVSPRDVPHWKNAGVSPVVYTLLTIAHIELTAVDSYWDTLLRFQLAPEETMPSEFFEDLAQVLHDEASHYILIHDRLTELGASYGDIPAHKTLWEYVSQTGHDQKARLAIVPLVQEARGLDAGPRLVNRIKSEGDKCSAEIMLKIVQDEEKHVAFGMKWFSWMCQQAKRDPVETFREYVDAYAAGGLLPPFNEEARARAGIPQAFYRRVEEDKTH